MPIIVSTCRQNQPSSIPRYLQVSFSASMPNTIESLYTIELLCEDKLKFVQKKKGYRFSIDAFLLANFITLKKGERLLDIGTGCGIIPIYIAKKGYTNDMLGVEIQDDLFNLAIENKRLNNVGNHIQFLKGDIKNHAKSSRKNLSTL